MKESWPIADELSAQFIQRRDIHVRQVLGGAYRNYKTPYFDLMMVHHLKGLITLGTYCLDENSQTRFVVIDGDHDIEPLKQLAWSMDSQSIPSYLETSRRGGHLWFFFSDHLTGADARRFGIYLTKDMEVYPKQEVLNGGPGSLIRVPFGVHLKTGQKYPFIHPNGEILGSWERQMERLAHPETVLKSDVECRQAETPTTIEYRGSQHTFDNRLAEFISQYVDLKPIASGYLGLCPFHDDHAPSFGINTEKNYWHCFSGCGGGDLISFYKKYFNVDYPTAVRELEKWNGREISNNT
jgi:hypothetical protein